MAELNQNGNILARCPKCDGAKSTFVYVRAQGDGAVVKRVIKVSGTLSTGTVDYETQYRLFECNTCGMGAVAAIKMSKARGSYPNDARSIEWFYPETGERLPLPEAVPDGIASEFREAEQCAEAGCFRASAAMFRSVLDKTLRANGSKTRTTPKLVQQIAVACEDGVITRARKRRADDEIRVLGNDVLHDAWREMTLADVKLAHHYTQRILEDLYDDRDGVVRQLEEAGRKPQDISSEPETTSE